MSQDIKIYTEKKTVINLIIDCTGGVGIVQLWIVAIISDLQLIICIFLLSSTICKILYKTIKIAFISIPVVYKMCFIYFNALLHLSYDVQWLNFM